MKSYLRLDKEISQLYLNAGTLSISRFMQLKRLRLNLSKTYRQVMPDKKLAFWQIYLVKVTQNTLFSIIIVGWSRINFI